MNHESHTGSSEPAGGEPVRGVSRRTVLGVAGAAAAVALIGVERPAFARADTLDTWDFTMGVNAAGLESTGDVIPGEVNTHYIVPTQKQLEHYQKRGMTHVRVPFKWERLQPVLGGPLDTAYLGYLQSVADIAASIGITIMLDNHNYGRFNNIPFGMPETPTSALADVWSRLATVFVGHTGVYGYDLMNEPHDMPSPSAWPTAAQAAVDAIRLVDTTTPIYVEGDHWSSSASWATVNASLNIIDPSDNIIYSAHMYYDRDSSGGFFNWDTEVAAGDLLKWPVGVLDVDTGKNRLVGFVNWLQTNGFRGHIGETGAPNTHPNWLIALDHALAYAQANGVPVTYWSAGGFFRSYPLGVEPTGEVDTVQMAVLTKYSGGAQPTNYLLTGPNRGTAGTASAPFTVDYRGLISTAVTVTPNDGGAGGTFSPTSITLAPGFNGLGTFTYTPSGVASYAIATTNSAGLTDPEPVGFSTRTDAFSAIPDAALLNVLAATRVFSPFAGNGLTLRRASDGTEQSFPYASGTSDALDNAAITAWAGGSTVTVKTIFDQSPARRDAGQVVGEKNQNGPTGAPLPTQLSDYPQLVLNGLAGQPVLRFNKSRMDAVSPIANITGFTTFFVAKPTNVAGMQRLLSWVLTDYVSIGNESGGWGMSAEGTVAQALGTDPTKWHIYAVRWQAGGARTSWVDGKQIASTPATNSIIPMAHDDHVNIGYFRWYRNVHFSGDVYGLFPFKAALSPTQMTAMWTDLSARTGIALVP
ncbi:glycoside hydrolase family 5 protein [Plantibacter sp. YIM 135249]|uniref:glycoside hydrolase family 5 protein n=1 Tax=Plantibacter sp. YIM 135249 TaxID=3423918 RepID=UPI003D32DF1C